MKYVRRVSFIDVLGYIWMPSNVLCSTKYTLREYDVENCRDDDGNVTRDSVTQWLTSHTGDFSSVEDWSGSLEVGDDTVNFGWEKPESEEQYTDTVSERGE